MIHGNSIKEFADRLPERIKQTGTMEEKSAWISLKAGKLKMIYSNGAFRYISSGSNELIRMIYAAVRDREWNSVTPVIVDEKIRIQEESFSITLKCLYHSPEINFSAEFSIEGKQDNSITIAMEGEALETFAKNRTGFCILHPVESCAGRNCIIEHPDGSSEQSFFPEEISPVQVFRDIKSMTWLSGRIKCRMDFEGDIFETEDQRNWTDASFKTYSTPLSVPYPAIVEKDTRIYQKVVFIAEGQFETETGLEEKNTIKLYPEETFRIPSIGICRSGSSTPINKNELKTIRAIRFDHYRVDLHLYNDNWITTARMASEESSDLGYQLELALFFDDNYFRQTDDFIKWYSEKKPYVSYIILFHILHPSTPGQLALDIIPLLREMDARVRIVTGTNANFAQLNRNRPGDTGADNVCYSIHPQEHLSDNYTLVENLKAQEYSVLSAIKFSGDKEIIISPVTIQRRFNANKSLAELPWSGHGIPPQVDSRQMSLFGGCWTAGSLKYLCESGPDSITYYETAGERGIIQGDHDSQWPLFFPAIRGMIFPSYHVFKFLLTNKSMRLIRSVSSNPLILDCLALTDGKQVRIILANFSGASQLLNFECCSGLFRIRTLNSDSFGNAASDPRWSGIENERVVRSDSTFELDPYSINFISGWRKH